MTADPSPTSPAPDFHAACERHRPRLALVLGSGLWAVRYRVEPIHAWPYSAVPGLTGSTIPGHRSQVTLGLWSGCPVLLFEGRVHLYEGHSRERVTAAVQLAARVGVRELVLTNAAGGIRDDLTPGSLMCLSNHVDAMRPEWWRQFGLCGSGEARPSPYSEALRQRMDEAAVESGLPLRTGVYAGLLGPSYETPAEIRALATWGVDAVGMSTVPEAEAAREWGLECVAVSCITNRAAGLAGPEATLNHEEVLAAVEAVQDRIGLLLEGFVRHCRSNESG